MFCNVDHDIFCIIDQCCCDIVDSVQSLVNQNLHSLVRIVELPVVPRMKKRSSTPDRNHLMGSVAGTFEVLEVFGQKSRPLSLGDIVSATGKPKSSVHRILSTLTNVGFLTQDANTRLYRLTLRVWRLGMSALGNLDVLKLSRPHLEALMKAADETVHLGMLDSSGGFMYVSKVESLRSIRVQSQIGRIDPSWCSATGRALLAFNPDVAEHVLAGPLVAKTPKSETDPKRLRAILADVAIKGYAVVKGESHPEMGGIAAPIRDHDGAVVAACSIAIPVFRMDRNLIQQCIPLVLRTAGAISAELGYQRSRKIRYGT